MRYKAIIFDLDGTAIPNRKDGMPSQHLIDLIQDLKNKVFVCAATARPFSICKEVLKSLQLISPCVVSGGTRIIDPVTNKTLWEKNIPDEIVGKIIDTTKLFEYKLFVSNGVDPFLIEKRTKDSERIIYIMSVSKRMWICYYRSCQTFQKFQLSRSRLILPVCSISMSPIRMQQKNKH